MIDSDNCLDCNSGVGCALHFNPPFGVGPAPIVVDDYRSKEDCQADNTLRDAARSLLNILDTIDDTDIDTRMEAKRKLLGIKAITIRALARIDNERKR